MDDGTTAGGSSFLTSSAEHQFSGDSHPIPPEVLELFDDPVEGEEVDDIITKGKVPFFAGNPTVGLVKGEIHIFKDTNIREIATNKTLPSARTRIVCVLAVPAWMSLADFYTFCGPHTAYLEQLRVLSDASPNRYMAVMKFKKQKQADDFYLQFNGKPFSSLAPEACYVGFVKKVEFLQPEDAQIFPLQGQVEIPTCPVCLERLDAAESGIMTILCQHAFHCKCLVRWKEENRCPVCRYVQQPSGKETRCNKCGTTQNLWICLVCGHVGCSRYQDLHAFEHYKETKHNYALELETQRVWDYAGDGYVHRLIQNKSDGKLVELPGPGQTTDDRSSNQFDQEKDLAKVDAVSLEYQYMLTAQLETQREWFEDQITSIEQQKDFKIRNLEGQKTKLLEQKKTLMNRVHQLELENQQFRNKQGQLEGTVKDLQDQVRDLMFFLEAQKTIASQNSELTDGQVLVVPAPSTPANTNAAPQGGAKKKRRGGKR